MGYSWKLNDSQFTFLDRLKICAFFLNPNNFWTQNIKVQEFEVKMAKLVGFQYSVFVSSGSSANAILAMSLRDKLKRENSSRNIIVLPSTTWTTSCSVFIREGFKPHFIDVSLDNFGMDLHKLNEYLSKNHELVAAVFPTSLLGFNLHYNSLKQIKQDYPEIEIFVDQCENNFGNFDIYNSDNFNLFTSTTSTYMGHMLQSCEGGFIFTNKLEEYESFLMYRNHGMTRSLIDTTFSMDTDGIINFSYRKYNNEKVDSRFDFYSLSSNFRNSDINAKIGLLDIKKVYKHIKKRRALYGLFQTNLNKDRYILPEDSIFHKTSWFVPFCIPIICKGDTAKERLCKIKQYCINKGIETRPIISGFLGYQTPYKEFMNEEDYPNSLHLHNFGIYCGLHAGVKEKDILNLTKELNKL